MGFKYALVSRTSAAPLSRSAYLTVDDSRVRRDNPDSWFEDTGLGSMVDMAETVELSAAAWLLKIDVSA